jgi:V/A-type H+/Na+-transporting ATPase subunit E
VAPMSAETLIAKIKDDAKKDAENIIATAKKQSKQLIDDAVKTAKKQADQIIEQGKKEQENIKRIKISQAQQETKRQIMQARETIIDECFQKALEQLKNIDDNTYTRMMETLIKQTSEQIPGIFCIHPSRSLDETIAKKHNIPVKGKIDASGGILIVSEDGRITIDNTFEGILKRKRDSIRVQVGKLLFS